MKKLLITLLCALLGAMGLALAGAEGAGMYSDTGGCYYHKTDRCALARYVEQESLVDAVERGRQPCPVCVPDEWEYSGIEAWERGGTLVLRIPDTTIEARMDGTSVLSAVPDRLLKIQGKRDDDIARLLHGQAYLDFLENAVPGTEHEATAFIPELDTDKCDALVMSSRHLGAAWYLVVRPDELDREAVLASGLSLPVRLWQADLRLAMYDAGATLKQGDRSRCWEGDITVIPKPSEGKVVYRDDEELGSYPIYVVRDDIVNIAVIRDMYHEESNLENWLQFCGVSTPLRGYRDGERVVFCCVMTDGELSALVDKLGLGLYPPYGYDQAYPADAATALPDYAPVTSIAMPDGTRAEMDQAAYPIGTGFVSYTLTRPEGGIAYYANEIPLERLSDGQWRDMGAVKGYADGDGERTHAGYFCDRVSMTLPLDSVGALEEGLYRACVSGWDDKSFYIEFRVEADAPGPTPPEKREYGGEGLIVLPHTPPSADAKGYNSCMDTSRVYEGSERTLLLAGDMVFELRGVDESWGWGLCTNYSLFAYPEGQGKQARQLLANIDLPFLTMYDAGDGLLLWSDSRDGMLYRCDYDGGNLHAIGIPTENDVEDILPVGSGVYAIGIDGIWYTPLDDFSPRLVYREQEDIQNGNEGTGFMVYAEGKLFIADGGIVALDTLNPDSDGTLPAKRLTDAYDMDDGENGYGYIVLNGRLYCWSEKKKAVVSMDLDGGDVRVVSGEHFWFNAVTPGGLVLALTGSQEGMFGPVRTGAAFYLPIDPADPTFDPDHCKKLELRPEDDCYVLGDYLYRAGRDGAMTPLIELG